MPKRNLATIAEYAHYDSALAEWRGQELNDLLAEMAERGRHDLHFFCVVALGIDCMTPTSGLHGRVCRFLDKPLPARKGLEVPRGGLKSTIATVGKSLQRVVQDPKGEHHLIVAADEQLAETFLGEIRGKVASARFQALYPECRPSKREWKGDKARLECCESREATWVASGIESQTTGGHYTRIHWDDLVVPKNVGTRAMALKIRERFFAMQPLVDSHDTEQVMAFTPYESFDLYAYLKHHPKVGFEFLSIPLLDAAGQSVWPEEFPLERVEQLRQDAKTWWSQYMLTPRNPDLQRFHPDRFRHFRWAGEKVRSDWEDLENVPVAITPESLTMYQAVDVAMGLPGGNETALAAVGIDKFNNVYVAETPHGLWDYTATIPQIWGLAERWDVVQTWVEMCGPHKSFATFLEQAMREEGRKSLWIDTAPTGNRNKEARCESVLAHLYNNRKIWHHQSLWGGELEQQLVDFPGGALDDVRDCVAYAVELAQKGGCYGEKRPDQVQQQRNSSFGLYEKIGLTLEQMQEKVPEGLAAYALGKAVRRGKPA